MGIFGLRADLALPTDMIAHAAYKGWALTVPDSYYQKVDALLAYEG